MDISELSDIQSESGVIGTLIYHPEFINHSEWLKPNHFYGTENACVYWAIQELSKKGVMNIDAYNIMVQLKSHPGVAKTIDKYNLPKVQDMYVLYSQTSRSTLEEYLIFARNITTLAFKRDLVKLLNYSMSECSKVDVGLEELNGKIYKGLEKLTEQYVMANNENRQLGEMIDDIWKEIESRRTEDGYFGIRSKYNGFNEYFTYEPGELVVLQAQYKQGKSVLLMNEVVHKLKLGLSVLVVDTEMQTRLYTERLLAHLTGIELKRVKSGNYNEQESARLIKAMQWIKTKNFVHIYDPNISMDGLYSLCKMYQNNMDLGFVVFDYLKSNETSTSDNYNILGEKCDYLKNRIAGELNLPVLTACQLNRNNEVADSIKINRYLSVGIMWGYKTQMMVAKDGLECGNAYAKIYVNRLGEQMQDDDEYIDFVFDGDKMTIIEAKKHSRDSDI